jgi:hypothetical protein
LHELFDVDLVEQDVVLGVAAKLLAVDELPVAVRCRLPRFSGCPAVGANLRADLPLAA